MVPMNLWYAGMFVGLWLHFRGDEHARRFAARLLQQMPIIVALGINFGIVPLLFIQVAYYKVFYPATILMAWAWMAIIGLLIPAYYGVYAYAWGIRNGKSMEKWRVWAGWVAAAFFIAIAFLFVNGLSLMEHVDRWPALWTNNNIAGAATGLALNVTDPTVLPRWFLMFGLAMGTTAVWMLVDAFLLIGERDDAYRAWATGFARNLYTLAMFWTAASGIWYIFVWSQELRDAMFAMPFLPLTILTALAMSVPWVMMLGAGQRPLRRGTVMMIALDQFGVLGINAASRQIVQNLNLSGYFQVLNQPEDVQWGPLAMFLIAFVLGVAVIAWMLLQIQKCKPAKA